MSKRLILGVKKDFKFEIFERFKISASVLQQLIIVQRQRK